MNPRELLGALLKGYRQNAGLTQAAARRCQRSIREVRLESGELKEPSILLALNYLSSLGVPGSRFFSERKAGRKSPLEGLLIREETKFEKEEKHLLSGRRGSF